MLGLNFKTKSYSQCNLEIIIDNKSAIEFFIDALYLVG